MTVTNRTASSVVLAASPREQLDLCHYLRAKLRDAGVGADRMFGVLEAWTKPGSIFLIDFFLITHKVYTTIHPEFFLSSLYLLSATLFLLSTNE